jgi:hypothetical protein
MYAKIKGLKYFPCGQFTSTQAQKFCDNDEIKFFDMKKQKMNYDLYHMHLQLSKEWNSSFGLIELCSVRLNKCGFFFNKHSRMASIKITDQLFCLHQLLD